MLTRRNPPTSEAQLCFRKLLSFLAEFSREKMKKPRIRCGFSFVLRLVMVFSAVIFARCQNNNDAQVMDALKKAIKFTNAKFWFDSDYCKWEFVKCNGAKVTSIQIGNQGLTGTLPKELENLTELEDFECMHNNLSGPFPNLASSLRTLFINDNSFSLLFDDFFSGKTMLGKVDIGDNPFPPWQIPGSLKDCISLMSFAATRVNFVGKIPEFLGKDGPLPSLTNLSMSFNSLEGELPASFSGSSIELLWLNGQKGNSKLNGTLAVLQNMTSLKQIWLHGNSFTGPIPDFTKHGQLYDVSIRDNKLTGIVPPSLVNLKSLKIVNLTNNYLQGPMPNFPAGVNVDMIRSNNKFCTNEPGQPCSRPVNDLLSVVEPLGYPLQFAKDWEGNDPCSRPWPHITCVNRNISVINFSNLNLTGTISPSYANLNSVTELLLQNNNLTGTIPRELTSMPLLEKLDVSNNQLYGAVPYFRVDVVLNLTGNPEIGKDKPSLTPGSAGSDSGSNNGTKKSRTGVIAGTVVGFIVLFCLAVLGFLIFQKKQKNSGKFQRPIMVVHPHRSTDDLKITAAGRAASGGRTDAFSPKSNAIADVQVVEAGSMVISIQVLREVTNNFSEENVLGRGGFGTVYRGELHDGTKIAVKRMETGMEDEKGLSEFKAEIAVLTRVRHKHLVALLGYCLDGNERLLVYEYMPQGTLSKYLFNWKSEDVKPLEWTRRLIIALDVARGVEYLHGLAQQIFIHRDLKPSNILLGDDMRAKVSDFGLVRLAPEGKASFETRLAGTFGYLAPEYAATGRVTTKVDVYSFGVILMEMITGRKAIDDSRPEENVHLVSWFRRMLLNQETFNTAIDPVIDAGEETLANITTVAELAGHCTAREPYQRPDMSHVVNVLSPLVEAWKPGEPDADDIYGVNLEMSLPQAMKRWQAIEGTSTMDMDVSSSSPFLTNRDNTQSSIPNRPSGFAASFTSTDGR